MHRTFRTRHFNRWMAKTGLTDQSLCSAVDEMRRGLIDAILGGNVVKKRVALPGRGKSGGSRTIVATNLGDRWFFIYGFEKNVRANITDKELEALQLLASDLLNLTDNELDISVIQKKLLEICHDH
jgi:hypothetical protein